MSRTLSPAPLAGLLLLLAVAGCHRAPRETPLPVPRALTTTPRYDGQPHVSPDGRSVVFSVFGDVDRDLFVMDLAGRESPRLLLGGPGDDEHPRWSPDGQTVVFSSDRGGSTDIWTVPASGGEPKRLTVEAGRDEQPDWSPNGDRIVFVSDRGGRPDLWILTLSTGTASPVTSGNPPVADYAVAGPV